MKRSNAWLIARCATDRCLEKMLPNVDVAESIVKRVYGGDLPQAMRTVAVHAFTYGTSEFNGQDLKQIRLSLKKIDQNGSL